MCERSPLFLSEAKSIIYNLLKRTLELFDLSYHFIEYYYLKNYLSQREQNHNSNYFSILKSCKLNHNIISDLNIYLHHLYTSCRLTKSYLRSLHASRITSSNDYIVIDDEIYELINNFKLKINKLSKIKKINSKQIDDYNYILKLFRKISQFYQFLIEQLYGIHIVRDSYVLQPIVIGIIRLLLVITNKLKQNIEFISQNKSNHNQFIIKQNEEICQRNKLSNKSKFNFIEIQNNENNDIRNDNYSKEDQQSLLDFDEDEFYRLANLERDD